jgi:hypothetical protein
MSLTRATSNGNVVFVRQMDSAAAARTSFELSSVSSRCISSVTGSALSSGACNISKIFTAATRTAGALSRNRGSSTSVILFTRSSEISVILGMMPARIWHARRRTFLSNALDRWSKWLIPDTTTTSSASPLVTDDTMKLVKNSTTLSTVRSFFGHTRHWSSTPRQIAVNNAPLSASFCSVFRSFCSNALNVADGLFATSSKISATFSILC